jgi:hypothetical protein
MTLQSLVCIALLLASGQGFAIRSTGFAHKSLLFASIHPPSADPLRSTLYEVLGAKGTETRSQLKQLYIKLAKETHPDAKVSARVGSQANHNFCEIAAAYQILSDQKQRRGYDRSLKAEQFIQDVVSWATEFQTKAAPVAQRSLEELEEVILPFLLRTMATTLASLQAGFWDLKKQVRESDSNKTFKKAHGSGKAIDHKKVLGTGSRVRKASSLPGPRVGESLVDMLRTIWKKRGFGSRDTAIL